MPRRVNVYLPDELVDLVERRLPGVSMSTVLQDALTSLANCRHDGAFRCATCAATLDAGEIRRAEVRRVGIEVRRRLDHLVANGATVTGAAAVVLEVFEIAGGVALGPAPRQSRQRRAEIAERDAQQAARERHPTARTAPVAARVVA